MPHTQPKKKKISFPYDFKEEHRSKLTLKVHNWQTNNRDKPKKLYNDVKEVFSQFFIDTLLDLTSTENFNEYCNVDKVSKLALEYR